MLKYYGNFLLFCIEYQIVRASSHIISNLKIFLFVVYTVPYIDEKIYQKAMYYRNKWCEEIKMVVALKEVVDCHDSTIEDMQQTLKKIEEGN